MIHPNDCFQVTLEKTFLMKLLVPLFVDKQVKITHTGNCVSADKSGICKAFHLTKTGFDMELRDGSRWSLIPDIITMRSVEGTSPGVSSCRREIALV